MGFWVFFGYFLLLFLGGGFVLCVLGCLFFYVLKSRLNILKRVS